MCKLLFLNTKITYLQKLPIPKKSSINANMDATLVGNFCAIALKLAVKKAAFPHPSKILKNTLFVEKQKEKVINIYLNHFTGYH